MLLSPVAMHIPDGFLSVALSAFLWIVSISVVGYSLKLVGKDLGERQVPLMGVLAAAIFAGQMLNFAVAGGTSGHLMGATLATILLGPWAAILVLTSVVSIQALIFQDGGLLALGANIFNMGIVGVVVAYMAFYTIQKLIKSRKWGLYLGGFIAAWLSIEVAALGVALQLVLSNTTPANLAIPTMAGVHALIGVGEGLITIGALAFISATRRDLIGVNEARPKKGGLVWLSGLLIALVLAIASPLASNRPDGLEWVAEHLNFLNTAQNSNYRIIPDYIFPGISNANLATILAGIVGVMIVFGVALALAYTRRSIHDSKRYTEPSSERSKN